MGMINLLPPLAGEVPEHSVGDVGNKFALAQDVRLPPIPPSGYFPHKWGKGV